MHHYCLPLFLCSIAVLFGALATPSTEQPSLLLTSEPYFQTRLKEYETRFPSLSSQRLAAYDTAAYREAKIIASIERKRKELTRIQNAAVPEATQRLETERLKRLHHELEVRLAGNGKGKLITTGTTPPKNSQQQHPSHQTKQPRESEIGTGISDSGDDTVHADRLLNLKTTLMAMLALSTAGSSHPPDVPNFSQGDHTQTQVRTPSWQVRVGRGFVVIDNFTASLVPPSSAATQSLNAIDPLTADISSASSSSPSANPPSSAPTSSSSSSSSTRSAVSLAPFVLRDAQTIRGVGLMSPGPIALGTVGHIRGDTAFSLGIDPTFLSTSTLSDCMNVLSNVTSNKKQLDIMNQYDPLANTTSLPNNGKHNRGMAWLPSDKDIPPFWPILHQLSLSSTGALIPPPHTALHCLQSILLHFGRRLDSVISTPLPPPTSSPPSSSVSSSPDDQSPTSPLFLGLKQRIHDHHFPSSLSTPTASPPQFIGINGLPLHCFPRDPSILTKMPQLLGTLPTYLKHPITRPEYIEDSQDNLGHDINNAKEKVKGDIDNKESGKKAMCKVFNHIPNSNCPGFVPVSSTDHTGSSSPSTSLDPSSSPPSSLPSPSHQRHTTFLTLKETEMILTYYPKGARYAVHYDQSPRVGVSRNDNTKHGATKDTRTDSGNPNSVRSHSHDLRRVFSYVYYLGEGDDAPSDSGVDTNQCVSSTNPSPPTCAVSPFYEHILKASNDLKRRSSTNRGKGKGGHLRLHLGNGEVVDIVPKRDRLVVFASEYLPHEVTLNQRDNRYAVTGWFRAHCMYNGKDTTGT